MAELLSMATPESQRLWDELSFAYTETQGHPKLRQEIAALYTEARTYPFQGIARNMNPRPSQHGDAGSSKATPGICEAVHREASSHSCSCSTFQPCVALRADSMTLACDSPSDHLSHRCVLPCHGHVVLLGSHSNPRHVGEEQWRACRHIKCMTSNY